MYKYAHSKNVFFIAKNVYYIHRKAKLKLHGEYETNDF